jgi:hypothetical protein
MRIDSSARLLDHGPMRATWLILVCTIVGIAGGCSVRVRPVTLVEIEPPADSPEVGPRSERSGHVWVKGRWEYRGSRWSWRAGEWQKVRQGYVWHDGDWERHGNRWHWVEGHWRGAPTETSSIGP